MPCLPSLNHCCPRSDSVARARAVGLVRSVVASLIESTPEAPSSPHTVSQVAVQQVVGVVRAALSQV
jgi:hypothetical protein